MHLGYCCWRFSAGFLGFGAALVIVPSLSIVLPPVFAIGILVIIEIPTIMYLVPANIRDANLKKLVPMLCGLVIGVPIGTLIWVETEPTIMKLIISCSVVDCGIAGVRLAFQE